VIPTARERRLRLFLFGSLYVAQGAILSYFLTFNILYLREFGFTAGDIGFFQATLVLPFILKILLGMVSDRFNLFGLGHRHPYIVLGLMIQIVGLLLMPLVSLPDDLGLFFALALAVAIGMALYDTCTDGLAVETTPADERGLVQGVMVGSRAGGILIALLLGSLLVDRAGWSWVFWMLAGLTLPGLLLVIAQLKAGRKARHARFEWQSLRSLLTRPAAALATVGCLYALATDGLLAYLSFHPDAQQVGTVGVVGGLVALSMLGRMLGAAASAALTDRIGRMPALNLSIGLTIAASLALSVQSGVGVLALACLVFGVAYGFFTTVYAAHAMQQSPPAAAASTFAIFMLFLNLGVAFGQLTGGMLTERLGFSGLAWLMIVVLLIVFAPARALRVR
jgi:PAT family beta-lactamase induction signal transducer AmpG